MREVYVRVLGLLVIGGMIFTLPACHSKPPKPQYTNHDRALAVAAQGARFLLKQPERSIEFDRQAIQLEPDNREWKSFLAFAYYRAHRNSEAIQVFQELAVGQDEFAAQAKHMLTKKWAQQKY